MSVLCSSLFILLLYHFALPRDPFKLRYATHTRSEAMFALSSAGASVKIMILHYWNWRGVNCWRADHFVELANHSFALRGSEV